MLLLILLISFITQAWGRGFEPIQVVCEINGHIVPAMIDTGAEITVMSASCARRCQIHNLIDTQHSGKAIGVGFSEIVGGIEGLGLRIGPINFRTKVSILRNSRCEFLIGLDVLQRFRAEISLKDRLLRLSVREDEIRIPISSPRRTLPISKKEFGETNYQDARKTFQTLRNIAIDEKITFPDGSEGENSPDSSDLEADEDEDSFLFEEGISLEGV